MIWSFGLTIKEQPADVDGGVRTSFKCLSCGAEFSFLGDQTVQVLHYTLIEHVLTHMLRKDARDAREERDRKRDQQP
jgi:hypothetical protein